MYIFFSSQEFTVSIALPLVNLILANTTARAHYMATEQTARAQPVGQVPSAALMSMNATLLPVEI